jgi:hypothetical protein
LGQYRERENRGEFYCLEDKSISRGADGADPNKNGKNEPIMKRQQLSKEFLALCFGFFLRKNPGAKTNPNNHTSISRRKTRH